MIDITAQLVRDLVRAQFPRWGDLPVRPVERQGWDNRTFRLGEELVVRLPSAEGYVASVAKEDRCLPLLAGHLPLPVPAPVAVGRPGSAYPFPWSVRRWLAGETVENAEVDRTRLAIDLGGFLTALRAAPPRSGPACGVHSFFRGCHPSAYSDEVQNALVTLGGVVDVAACEAVWTAAITTVWTAAPAWFHGDVAVGNLLATDGKLSAVIDFGTCGVGDPACDLVMGWTYFAGDERKLFREAAGLDDGTWRRARGWALWKELITLAGQSDPATGNLETRILVD